MNRDPLVTREIRLAQLERLVCRLADMKAIGVRWPQQEINALVNIIVSERRGVALSAVLSESLTPESGKSAVSTI